MAVAVATANASEILSVRELNEFAKMAGPDNVRAVLAGHATLTVERLLVEKGFVDAKAVKSFLPADRLKACNIGFTGSNFDRVFLKKNQPAAPACRMTRYHLAKDLLDDPIRKALGEGHEGSLGYLFDQIELQSQGQEGDLLTSGYANVLYVFDDEGKPWAVGAGWVSVSRFWRVEASPAGIPYGWGKGDRFFSCNSKP